MLLCNVKFSLLGLFLPRHAACQYLYLCLHLLLHLYLNWCVGIHYSTGRQASGGIWRIGWFAGVERTREPLLYCTVLTGRTREETKEGAPGIHLGPDNSLRFGLLPVASSHLAWTFGFFGFQWRHQGNCGHLEWTDWFNWLVSHKFHYFQLGSTLWAAIIILAGRCQKTEWEVIQWQLQLFLFEVLAIRSS